MTSDRQPGDARALLPLRPTAFHILVSLAEQKRHGYAIIKEIERRTDGQVVILAGALYRFLKRMLEDGLIEEAEEALAGESGDTRRRYYQVTDFGRAVAGAEMERLEQLLRDAKAARLRPMKAR
jgi:DNA-binding PadR family transcriptional regulator